MLKKFAEDLKIIREKKGKTLHDIANETRIHISNFEKIENGEFNFLPQPYIRAFLRQYFKCIGLNEKEGLYDFDLAKSGKYQSKVASEKAEEKKITPATFDKSFVREPVEKKSVEEIPEIKDSQDLNNIFEEKEKPIELVEPVLEIKNKEPVKYSTSKKVEMESNAPENDYSGKVTLPDKDSAGISSSFFKTIGIVLVVLVLLFAVYLLITQVFLAGPGKSKVEIVRQNFDEVVKESEKKILGKRSDEEIADSLRKAEQIQDSIKRAMNDSLKLEIKGLSRGVIYITVDSLLEKNIKKESYAKDFSGTWKAKKCFYITSGNTESFDAYLNGKKLNFNNKTVRLQKITKEGLGEKEVIKIKKSKPKETDINDTIKNDAGSKKGIR